MPRPVATQGSLTDIPGVPGRLVAPQAPITSITPTVIANGRPVLTIGAIVPTHGNPTNPKAPGYDTPRIRAEVVGKLGKLDLRYATDPNERILAITNAEFAILVVAPKLQKKKFQTRQQKIKKFIRYTLFLHKVAG